ncbi:MAG: GNAT family protein [Pseudomonadota bacterium]
MSEPPNTKLVLSERDAGKIRMAVRAITTIDVAYGVYAPASFAVLDEFQKFLADARVSGPLYTIPENPAPDWVPSWIEAHALEQAEGSGALLIARDDAGRISGFVDLQVWPEWGVAEFGGAIRADLQSGAMGTRGAARLFDWLFAEIGVQLIAMTNALDNVRTERLLHHLGFVRGTDRNCKTPEGDIRLSMYWELQRDRWHEIRPTLSL